MVRWNPVTNIMMIDRYVKVIDLRIWPGNKCSKLCQYHWNYVFEASQANLNTKLFFGKKSTFIHRFCNLLNVRFLLIREVFDIQNSEFAICHVVRHGNVNSIQNPSTVTNPTMESYSSATYVALPYNVTNRKLTGIFKFSFIKKNNCIDIYHLLFTYLLFVTLPLISHYLLFSCEKKESFEQSAVTLKRPVITA